MNTLKYKGFIGSVAFSEKDNLFFGKIEGRQSTIISLFVRRKA